MYHDYSPISTLMTPGEPSDLAKARELLARESRKPRKHRPERQRAAVEQIATGFDPRSTAFLYLA
ncbi:MAG: hypothetical protein HY875_00100 [Chloroflexi bacterium]|nr:hypothetical protein [Chloroflexota bacterium]